MDENIRKIKSTSRGKINRKCSLFAVVLFWLDHRADIRSYRKLSKENKVLRQRIIDQEYDIKVLMNAVVKNN